MDKSLLNPIGPLGSIVIGIVMLVLAYAGIYPGGLNLGWLGLAFLLGGAIMLLARMMTKKNTELTK